MAKSNTHSQVFHSLGEFIEFGKGPENGHYGRSSREESRDSWFGTPSFEAACELAEKGWSTKRRTLNDQVSAIVNEAIEGGWGVNGITFDYSEYGTDVDVDRFLMGEPKNMIEWQPTTDRPAIRLVMSCAYACSMKADQIIKRGAAVAALVEALGQAGISIEIWVEMSGSAVMGPESGAFVQTFVRVKSFTEPLDIDAFVYVAAHPSFFRRHVFAAWERLPEQVRYKIGAGNNGTHGYSYPKTAKDYSVVGGVDIAVESMRHNQNDPLLVDPLGWIKKTIQDLNLKAA